MTVWKYPLTGLRTQTILMPVGATILTVQMQRGTPCLWVLLDENQPGRLARNFLRLGTNHRVSDDLRLAYIGTYQVSTETATYHVFEAVGGFGALQEETPDGR